MRGSSLQLEDATGITMLPNDELFGGMGQMGYPTDGTFTFWKSFFTPQWRYLVHHLLHCISSKSGGWDQFGSNIATALISEQPLWSHPLLTNPFSPHKNLAHRTMSMDDLPSSGFLSIDIKELTARKTDLITTNVTMGCYCEVSQGSEEVGRGFETRGHVFLSDSEAIRT
ncbi:hypothetical protein Tco_0045946 [Tanacetum coccineum]